MKILLAILLFCTTTLNAQTDFSQENALAILKHLSVDIGPRPMGSPAEQQALQFAVQKFKEYGCDTAFVMPMLYTSSVNTNSGIAVGIKHGNTKRIIVVGGHIDSEGPEVPGADDDGSGSATVIELARVFGKRQMQSTLVFCCFGGEEEGLRGSRYFVDNFPDIDSVAFMLQIDMANGLGDIDIDPDTHGQSAPRWLTRAAVEEFNKLGYDHLRYPTHFFSMNYAFPQGSGSDHQSFLDRGIPAIDFSTDVGKPIHTPRDNFENFEPDGLQRSGMLVQKLIERFDTGTPSRSTEQYWFYLLGSTPIMIPFWGLWVFIGVTFITALIAFVAVRLRREPPDAPDRIRWSTIKMILFSWLITSCGWFASDIVGLLRGLRHPWYTTLDAFILQAFVASCVGGWIVLQLTPKLPLSRCPYVHFKRAAIILSVFVILGWLVDFKLVVEPATALFLVSLAILVRNRFLRLILLALSPVWVFRLIFHEWRDIIFRSIGNVNTSELWKWALFNSGFIIFLSIILLPFLFAITAIIRDTTQFHAIVHRLKSVPAFITVGIIFIALTGYLLTVPVYTNLWYRNVKIEQRYDMNARTSEISLRSSEFLSGLKIQHGGTDTVLTAKSIIATIPPKRQFDSAWVTIDRQELKQYSDRAVHYDIQLRLLTVRKPLSVTVSYSMNNKSMPAFDTPWKFHTERSRTAIKWYSFPDSNLVILVQFSVVGNDSVLETIEVEFDRLVYPMEFEQEKTYYIPRTKYAGSYWYKADKTRGE